MFIGDLRRKLFIPIEHEWNGIVRDITAKYETSGEDVNPDLVCDALARFYKDRATLVELRQILHIPHVDFGKLEML